MDRKWQVGDLAAALDYTGDAHTAERLTWREPPELLARTINRVRTFLRAHQPMKAAAQ